MLLNPLVATRNWVAVLFDWVADDCNCVKVKSLFFRNEIQEVRDRFKVKTFFLENFKVFGQNQENPRQIQSEDLFLDITTVWG